MKCSRGHAVRAAVLSVIVAGAFTTAGSTVSAYKEVSNRMTFGRPVALPGVVLPRGSYVFQISRLDSNVSVMQLEKPNGSAPVLIRVTSSNGRTVHFEGFTWRVPRPSDLPAEDVLALGEAPRGNPTPIRVWYPIGEAYGHKFIW